MRGKSLIFALLLVLVGAMAIAPVMADTNVFSQTHIGFDRQTHIGFDRQTHIGFDRTWTHYSIFLKAMGIVPVIPTHEITFTPVTQTSKPASHQPAPGKDYVFLYPTGADK